MNKIAGIFPGRRPLDPSHNKNILKAWKSTIISPRARTGYGFSANLAQACLRANRLQTQTSFDYPADQHCLARLS